MGKSGGFMTPKAIANRIKAKGLQKLRWYCEMCQKQCRDENGFKCHCESESHQRQMLLFSTKSSTFMSQFSQEFESNFLELLRRRFQTKRVAANMVYNEYISDRTHTHMNATQWETLTDFVKYLGKTSKCEVDETPKGWYIAYIDRDPEAIKRREAMEKKEKMDIGDEARHNRYLQKQIEQAQAQGGAASDTTKYTDLQRQEGQEIKFEMKPAAAAGASGSGSSAAASSSHGVGLGKRPAATANVFGVGDDDDSAKKRAKSAGGTQSGGGGAKLSNLELLRLESDKQKQRQARIDFDKAAVSKKKDYWLMEGIVVKIMNKKLKDGKYYKQKGYVRKVIDKYVGEVKLLEGSSVIKLDQDDLETVIPVVGGRVYIVNTGLRGLEAEVISINVEKFCADVKIVATDPEDRKYDGFTTSMDYEHISKVYTG
eukprot:GFYU01011194.1.p1 GENE.GFYU01011194.1~~GFYU01011194.1.p1  ORF type:complete len:428 (-),score=140.75 GFYU01011194.1:154-1437(-)